LRLLREGAAGFGEIAVEHFAGDTPYQSVAPDHPLLLLLAGIAGQSGVPLVVHMEASADVDAFERLVARDPRAKIVWAHVGADSTGRRTPDLCRRLLRAHANLFMDLKVDPRKPGLTPLLDAGKVRADWLQLLHEFSDRFVIGSDQHYPGDLQRWRAAVTLLEQLPPDLREKIGRDNALRLYRKGSK
jgi:predicted TIM-barrel fold metal-dependent hydrolase